MAEELELVKISQLPETSNVAATDVVPVVQNGTTKKASLPVIRDYVVGELGSAAQASTTDFEPAGAIAEVENQLAESANQQNERIDRLEYSIYLIQKNGLFKAYRTKALMLADVAIIPVNSIVSVVNDPANNAQTNDINGEYHYNGTDFFKLPNNLLDQLNIKTAAAEANAKSYADVKKAEAIQTAAFDAQIKADDAASSAIDIAAADASSKSQNAENNSRNYSDFSELALFKALHARFGVSKNLLSRFSTSSNSSVVLAILNWVGDAQNTNGVFCALRLSVTGANYPNVANDSTVFNSPLRLQGFAGSTLVFSQNLIRLSNTDVWYYRDKTLARSDITELKIFAYPASGVTISFENAVIHNDAGFGNPEIDARNTAIEESKKQINESIISSLFTADTNNRALIKEVKNATSIQQIYSDVLTENLKKLSVGCLIECDDTYPDVAVAGGVFALRAEIVNSSNVVIGSFFLKRITNTKIWYRHDIDISAFETMNGRLKLTIPVPSGSTFVTIKHIVFGDMGLPQPLFDLLKSSVTSDVIETATEVAQQTAESAISSGNLGWPSTAFDAISRADSRRVDIVALGDSNQLMDGYGFDGALRNALSNRFGLYATPPMTGGNSVYFPEATTGASSEQSKYVLASLNYLYVADDATISSAALNGVTVGGSTSNIKYRIDTSSKLRCHFAYSTFASGAGSFKPGVRIEQSPWSVKKMSDLINTNTGNESKVLTYFDLDADAARTGLPLGFKWTVPQQSPITGSFLSYFMRIEDLNKENGICFSTLYGVGGRSLWDMAARMYGFDDSSDSSIKGYKEIELTNYFSEIRRLQLSKSQEPMVVIYINSGLNDQNETSSPSWGWRESTDGKSATAYLDNLEALAKRISDLWQVNGWNEKELFFWINPSHPTSTPDVAKLRAYRKAAYTFAGSRSRVSVVDFENLTSESELTANNWYRTSDDHYHLKLAGYEALSQRIVDLIN